MALLSATRAPSASFFLQGALCQSGSRRSASAQLSGVERGGASLLLSKQLTLKRNEGHARIRASQIIRRQHVRAGAAERDAGVQESDPRVQDRSGVPGASGAEDGERNGDTNWQHLLKKLAPAILLALVVATLWQPSRALASAVGGEHFVWGGGGGATATVLHRVTGAEFLTAAWTGLVAGWLHTLSGPDHLAALAPLSIGRTRMESAAVGALWGCGHDAGQVLFGIAFVLLRDKLHLDLFRLWGSRIVGLTLMTIGGMGVYESSQLPIQCDEGDDECLSQPGAVVFSTDKRVFSVATFVTGIVHGLQPDALLVILPALALPSKVAGAAFLGMFLVGTVMAMGAYTSLIGIVSEACNKRVPWLTSRLSFGASIVAISVGLGIILGEIFGFSIFG